MIIYISGKYSDDTQEKIDVNIALARKHAIKLWEAGYTVICPHLNTANFEKDCSIKWEDYIKGDLEIVSRCDAVVMLHNMNDSQGALMERTVALEKGIPVFHSTSEDDFSYITRIKVHLYNTEKKRKLNFPKFVLKDDKPDLKPVAGTYDEASKQWKLETIEPSSIGVKHDDGKLHWSLVDYKQIEKLVDILTLGEKKYAANNWMHVDNFNNRYFDALMRHITAWKYGDTIDKEWNKSHLSHAMANLMFLMWGEDNGKK
jgi:hypothetical protein